MKSVFQVLFLSILLISSSALASTAFWDEIQISQNACGNLACDHSTIRKKLITTGEWRRLAPKARGELRRIARSLVNENWPDTILEGDYIIKGHTRLDNVYFLLKDDQIIGFWMLYSVKAWDVSSCDYDPIGHKDLTGCIEGRISEGAFVHLNLKTFEVDRYHAADFEAL